MFRFWIEEKPWTITAKTTLIMKKRELIWSLHQWHCLTDSVVLHEMMEDTLWEGGRYLDLQKYQIGKHCFRRMRNLSYSQRQNPSSAKEWEKLNHKQEEKTGKGFSNQAQCSSRGRKRLSDMRSGIWRRNFTSRQKSWKARGDKLNSSWRWCRISSRSDHSKDNLSTHNCACTDQLYDRVDILDCDKSSPKRNGPVQTQLTQVGSVKRRV